MIKKMDKRGRGRPRIDPESPSAVQIAVRLPDRLYAEFANYVEKEKERSKVLGQAGVVSASSIARMWIEERLLIERRLELEAQQIAAKKKAPERPLRTVWDILRENVQQMRAEQAAAGKPKAPR